MKQKQLLSMVIGLTASVLSQNLWAQTCNSNITITKPNGIYVDHLDGTVTDTETGLQWQKCSLGQTWNAGADVNNGSDDTCTGTAVTSTWQAALAQANNNIFVAKEWRLPNKNELKSLAEGACYDPAINMGLFPNVPIDTANRRHYWSASPNATHADSVWYVDFVSGGDGWNPKNLNYFFVRLVRSSN